VSFSGKIVIGTQNPYSYLRKNEGINQKWRTILNMNWYKRAQFYNKIRRKDYVGFHKNLLLGIEDEALLSIMVEDLKGAVRHISENSQLATNPSYGRTCPKCGEEMDWDENPTPGIETGYPDLAMGYWHCQNCGNTIDYEKYFEEREYRYTEQIDSLLGSMVKINQAKDFATKSAYFEQVIEFIHGRGKMADWLIEGGSDTINFVRRMA